MYNSLQFVKKRNKLQNTDEAVSQNTDSLKTKTIWGIVAFVLAIMGFISALNGEEKALPIVGGIKLLK